MSDKDHVHVAVVDQKGAQILKKKLGEDMVYNVYIQMDPEKAFRNLSRRDGKKNAAERVKVDMKNNLFSREGYDCVIANDSSIRNLAYDFMNYTIAIRAVNSMKEGLA